MDGKIFFNVKFATPRVSTPIEIVVEITQSAKNIPFVRMGIDSVQLLNNYLSINVDFKTLSQLMKRIYLNNRRRANGVDLLHNRKARQ